MRRHSRLSRSVTLLAGLALMVAVGTGLLMLPASGSTRALHWNEALFTAVSALSTTGLSIITPGRDLSIFGQTVLLGLMQVGGIGFMAGVVVVLRLLGRRVTFQERTTLRDSLGVPTVGSILRLTWMVLLGVVAVESLGAVVLWVLWAPRYGALPGAYYAVWHSVSAFCNASFDLLSGAPDAPAGFPTDAATLITISLLVILGSIGIPVLSDIFAWVRRGRRLSLHTRLTLATSAFLVALGTLTLFADSFLAQDSWSRRLVLCFFHSATSRTSGFVIVPLDTIPPASVLVLTFLMFVGGSPASMGGGITTSTVIVLALALKSQARGWPEMRAGRRSLPADSVPKAVAVLTTALALCIVVSWLLLMTQQATLAEAVFETVSAFSTCGFTLGLTPRLDLLGQLLIAATMFCGRLGVLTVVVALTQPQTRENLVTYPEEPILMA